MTQLLNQPPFPPLTWDETYWVGTVLLPTWAGFRVPKDAWGAVDTSRASEGTAQLIVEGPDDRPLPPSADQVAAFQHLIDNEAEMRDRVLQALFDYYQENQEAYGYEKDIAAPPHAGHRTPGRLETADGPFHRPPSRIQRGWRGVPGFRVRLHLGCVTWPGRNDPRRSGYRRRGCRSRLHRRRRGRRRQ